MEPASPDPINGRPDEAEDRESARLVARFQAGEEKAFSALYRRYFNRVCVYLRIGLRDAEEAEDAAQEVFIKVLKALPRYEQRKQPFRAWLFTIVRNHALDELRKRRPDEPVDPQEIEERADRAAEPEPEPELEPELEPDLPVLDWITDPDLLLFVERLPESQRQVLMLRYLLDLAGPQIGEILNRTPDDVRMLHHRAVHFLRDRLIALGRDPKTGRRATMGRGHKQNTVLRARRWILDP